MSGITHSVLQLLEFLDLSLVFSHALLSSLISVVFTFSLQLECDSRVRFPCVRFPIFISLRDEPTHPTVFPYGIRTSLIIS